MFYFVIQNQQETYNITNLYYSGFCFQPRKAEDVRLSNMGVEDRIEQLNHAQKGNLIRAS